ncbi:MAG: hypothetical protein ACPL09_06470, partial [Candidatus Methanodesulfokora sp.]
QSLLDEKGHPDQQGILFNPYGIYGRIQSKLLASLKQLGKNLRLLRLNLKRFAEIILASEVNS